MNLEKEMEKLRKVGYKDSEKDLNKLLNSMRFYEKTHDKTENRARQQYELVFDFSCRQAEEFNMELWAFLSKMYMIPGEDRFIKPPADLYNKKEKQDWIKREFRQYFYECMINCVYFPITRKLYINVLPHRKAGNETVKITKKGRIAKEEKIRKKIKELIALGKISPSIKRGDITTIAKALKFRYNYVQEYIKLQKRTEPPKC